MAVLSASENGYSRENRFENDIYNTKKIFLTCTTKHDTINHITEVEMKLLIGFIVLCFSFSPTLQVQRIDAANLQNDN